MVTDTVREFLTNWFAATARGDIAALASMIADDVSFVTSERPPFGKTAFLDSFRSIVNVARIDCVGEYTDIQFFDSIACTIGFLSVAVTKLDGSGTTRIQGYVSSVLKLSEKGEWQLFRDANLLAPIRSQPSPA